MDNRPVSTAVIRGVVPSLSPASMTVPLSLLLKMSMTRRVRPKMTAICNLASPWAIAALPRDRFILPMESCC
jgi:hypothetical protein